MIVSIKPRKDFSELEDPRSKKFQKECLETVIKKLKMTKKEVMEVIEKGDGKKEGGGNNNKIVSVKKLSGKECYDLVKVMGLSDYQYKIF